MTDQVTDTPAVVPYAPKEKSAGSEAEIVDRAGNAILGLVSRAADAAAADLQEAREVAEKLADQLRAAHDQLQAAQDQINNLEADVRYYQDRTDRAEKWLHQISSKIEQRFFDATGRQPLIQAQVEMTALNVAPPIEELIQEETQRIAAKFAPDFLRASRN
jgi:chromosome segregation ATPase